MRVIPTAHHLMNVLEFTLVRENYILIKVLKGRKVLKTKKEFISVADGPY